MPGFLTRKRDGQHFPVGDPRVDARRRAYLRGLLREGKSYDLNELVLKMRKEGHEADVEARKAQGVLAKSEGKMSVVDGVLEVLEEIKASGRTRVSDAELKGIMQMVMKEGKVPPSVLE